MEKRFKKVVTNPATGRKKTVRFGQAGEAYLKDDNAFRQTVISRKIGGDRNLPPLTSDALKEADVVNKELNKADKASKPTITQSIMSAMGMKRK